MTHAMRCTPKRMPRQGNAARATLDQLRGRRGLCTFGRRQPVRAGFAQRVSCIRAVSVPLSAPGRNGQLQQRSQLLLKRPHSLEKALREPHRRDQKGCLDQQGSHGVPIHLRPEIRVHHSSALDWEPSIYLSRPFAETGTKSKIGSGLALLLSFVASTPKAHEATESLVFLPGQRF